jgi:hypothetical protein
VIKRASDKPAFALYQSLTLNTILVFVAKKFVSTLKDLDSDTSDVDNVVKSLNQLVHILNQTGTEICALRKYSRHVAGEASDDLRARVNDFERLLPDELNSCVVRNKG